MGHSRKHPDRTRAALASAAVVVALVAPGGAHALSHPTASPGATPFPVPASARVKPAHGGAPGARTGTVTTATTPTSSTPASATPTTTVTTTPRAPSATTAPVARPLARRAGASKLSTPAVVVAAIAALVALCCALWGVARLQAFEPRWTLSLRHSLAEAGFRASATWAEFSDWARLGR